MLQHRLPFFLEDRGFLGYLKANGGLTTTSNTTHISSKLLFSLKSLHETFPYTPEPHPVDLLTCLYKDDDNE